MKNSAKEMRHRDYVLLLFHLYEMFRKEFGLELYSIHKCGFMVWLMWAKRRLIIHGHEGSY